MKSKTSVATGVVTDVAQTDVLSAYQSMISSLTQGTATAKALELQKQIETDAYALGGVLSKIAQEGWYQPYASFKEFVESELDMSLRTANYHMALYVQLRDANISWSDVKELGWSKLKEIAPFLTKDNLSEWKGKCEGLSLIQVTQMMKALKDTAKAGGTNATVNLAGKPDLKAFTLKVSAEVKDALMAVVAECTSHEEAAHRFISSDGNANTGKVNVATMSSAQQASLMKELMKARGYVSVLTAFEELWPNINISVEDPAKEDPNALLDAL